MTFSVLGTLGVARIGTSSRDSTQRQRLSARRPMFVPEVGADWRWQPAARVRIAINAGATVGTIRPFASSGIVDGYAPFDDVLRLRRAWVGLTWEVRPRRSR